MRPEERIMQVEDGVNGYVDVVRWVLERGRSVAPRGMETREIEDAVVYIKNPHHTLPLGVGRNAVPGIGAVEATQLLAGVSDPKLVMAVGPQFSKYAEDDGMFHGAYGVRTNGQYARVVERLQQDPSTRQALVTIWNPELDLMPDKRDYPCTVLHQFRIRNNRLNMSVYMRSNDVWLGAAYDWFQFTRVQIAIASVLGIEPGLYAHHVGSLHIYETHYETARALKYTDTLPDIPAITGSTWEDIETSALLCISAANDSSFYGSLHDPERWYTDAMLTAIERNRAKEVRNGK